MDACRQANMTDNFFVLPSTFACLDTGPKSPLDIYTFHNDKMVFGCIV